MRSSVLCSFQGRRGGDFSTPKQEEEKSRESVWVFVSELKELKYTPRARKPVRDFGRR